MSAPTRSRASAAIFTDVLAEHPNAFVESFMNAPSPGIVAAAIRNQHYDTHGELPAALGGGAAGRVRSDRARRFRPADRRARPRAGAAHLVQGPAARRSSSPSSRRWLPPSIGARATCRPTACACTSAGAIPNRRTIATFRWTTYCRACSRPRSADFTCRSRARAMRTNSIVSLSIRCTTSRFSWPASSIR